MKPYSTLFFDVDNTLLDFRAAEDQALHKLFASQHVPLTDRIMAHYRRINQGIWQVIEQGKADRDSLLNKRFSRLFRHYGKRVDGPAMEKKYREYLSEGHQLVDGALEMIRLLHNRYNLYVITNGVRSTQLRRLRDSGLLPLFRKIFVSETAGYQKPMRAFFDYAFARVPDFSKDQALMIGDSLSSDIKGGYLAGLDTCWFNPDGVQNTGQYAPTYQMKRLVELKGILG